MESLENIFGFSKKFDDAVVQAASGADTDLAKFGHSVFKFAGNAVLMKVWSKTETAFASHSDYQERMTVFRKCSPKIPCGA